MVEEFKRKYGEFVWIYQLGKLMRSLVQADIGCKPNSEPRVNTPFLAYLLKFEQKIRLFSTRFDILTVHKWIYVTEGHPIWYLIEKANQSSLISVTHVHSSLRAIS